MDDDRRNLADDRAAIANLVAVDRAVPCCATVDELVTQHVEAVEDDRQHARGVLPAQRTMRGDLRLLETAVPHVLINQPLLVIPVGLEDIPVIEMSSRIDSGNASQTRL